LEEKLKTLVPPKEKLPEITAESSYAELKKYLRIFRGMSTADFEWRDVNDKVEELNDLEGDLGRTKVGLIVESFQIQGDQEVEDYLRRLESEFADIRNQVMAEFTEKTKSAASAAEAQVPRGRWAKTLWAISQWLRGRNVVPPTSPVFDNAWFTPVLAPTLRESFEGVWKGSAKPESAYVSTKFLSVDADFLKAFSSKPDLQALGYDPQVVDAQSPEAFLARQRFLALLDQMEYSYALMNLSSYGSDAKVIERFLRYGHHGWDIRASWIARRNTLADGTTQKVLSVALRISHPTVGGSSPRSKEPAKETSRRFSDVFSGGLVPVPAR
jgi:hypothetical protein